jgi:RimJ/RimL family protein N-acetyltransferase
MNAEPSIVTGNYWTGTRLRLRAVEPGDAEAHHRFNMSEDYALIDRFYPPGSLARVQDWAEKKSMETFDGQTWHFQMESLETGELVGGIATHDCDPRVGTLSYGLHVFAEHRGRGHASEAVCMVLRYYFQELRYQKANVQVFAFNEPSRRLHESLGFQVEGRIRRTVYTKGEFHDMIWYGLTAEEFRERHPGYWRA